MQKQISYRIFVGNRPLEDLSPAERKEFAKRCAERMGTVLNEHFGQHPEEYEKVVSK